MLERPPPFLFSSFLVGKVARPFSFSQGHLQVYLYAMWNTKGAPRPRAGQQGHDLSIIQGPTINPSREICSSHSCMRTNAIELCTKKNAQSRLCHAPISSIQNSAMFPVQALCAINLFHGKGLLLCQEETKMLHSKNALKVNLLLCLTSFINEIGICSTIYIKIKLSLEEKTICPLLYLCTSRL